jgi:DNA-binding GntR family transcriptional regulator
MEEEPKFPYRRIADDLREQIESGKLAGQLPTRARLAETYGVSDMTVGAALKVLKDEGLIYGVAGLGTFVRSGL